jgi:hypothetical protein
MSESVTLLVASLYAEAIEAVKLHAALSASIPELISILVDIHSEPEALKPIPISEIFNMFRKIPNFDIIQYVEYYWSPKYQRQ